MHLQFRKVVGLALVIISPVAANADDKTFRKFVSKEGRFTVEMPGKPETKTSKREHLEIHEFTVKNVRDRKYTVRYVENKNGWTKDLPQFQIRTVRPSLHRPASFEDDETIELGKNKIPGLAYLVVLIGDFEADTYIREQAFMDGDRLYVISVTSLADKSHLVSKDVDRFFSSFQITPK